jgi:hypothetical protein
MMRSALITIAGVPFSKIAFVEPTGTAGASLMVTKTGKCLSQQKTERLLRDRTAYKLGYSHPTSHIREGQTSTSGDLLRLVQL